jgi:hypothetical protein
MTGGFATSEGSSAYACDLGQAAQVAESVLALAQQTDRLEVEVAALRSAVKGK